MSAAWILTLSLVGPPPDEIATNPTVEASQVSMSELAKAKPKTYTAGELRELYVAAMQKSAKRARAMPERVVVDLVTAYGEIDHVKRMAHSEKKKMRVHIESRLTTLKSQMTRENRRREQTLAKARQRKSANSKRKQPIGQKSLNATAAEIARANELIALIQATIKPESWDVNGGTASIRYFPLLKVLVVRASGEVHHRIGGALRPRK